MIPIDIKIEFMYLHDRMRGMVDLMYGEDEFSKIVLLFTIQALVRKACLSCPVPIKQSSHALRESIVQ